jgi:hypothetical protein
MLISFIGMLALTAIAITYVFGITYWLAGTPNSSINCPYTTTAIIFGAIFFVGLTPIGAIPIAFFERIKQQSFPQVFNRPNPEWVKNIIPAWEEACKMAGRNVKYRIVRLDSHFPWIIDKTVYIPDAFAEAPHIVMRDVFLHEIGHIALGHGKIHILTNVLFFAPRLSSYILILPRNAALILSQVHFILAVILFPIYLGLTLVDELLTILWDSVVEYTSRRDEHLADEFAIRHGAGEGLCAYLRRNECEETRSHPASWDRLERISLVRSRRSIAA